MNPLIAFLGGVLTLLAPCSVMLLPAFFSYAFQSPQKLIARCGIFWLGLLTPLIPLGAALSSVVALIREHSAFITHIIALLVIIAGLITLFSLDVPVFRVRSLETASQSRDTAWAVYLLGITYGIAGVGCAGPILGAVLATSSLGGSIVEGIIAVIFYSAGMAFPLLVLALLWQHSAGRIQAIVRPKPLTLLKRQTTWTNVVSGLVLIILGFTIFTIDLSNPLGGIVSIDTLASWEESIMGLFGALPAWVITLAGALIIGAIVALLWKPRSASLPSSTPSKDQQD
ncbi:cytochrome c biogenesis CcdA family protein [uncultured Actinomyces sp.]|uniref:cytochrome c biogenesis CcdA family protein n=1 Tax=uncultured Actinomyces sp. TaxID=249061 RepID=UPI0028E37063|nr:cytochrome c biogenesis CcdA family protein [uncultured Actinomyces sp.]